MRVQERGVGRSEVGKQRVKVRREGSREGRVGEMHGLLSIDDVGSRRGCVGSRNHVLTHDMAPKLNL